jgi:hypothetical protein
VNTRRRSHQLYCTGETALGGSITVTGILRRPRDDAAAEAASTTA